MNILMFYPVPLEHRILYCQFCTIHLFCYAFRFSPSLTHLTDLIWAHRQNTLITSNTASAAKEKLVIMKIKITMSQTDGLPKSQAPRPLHLVIVTVDETELLKPINQSELTKWLNNGTQLSFYYVSSTLLMWTNYLIICVVIMQQALAGNH